jgi:type II secretory pathway predicted ATPase ExeA
MYEAFFGFRDRPFTPAPLAKRHFAGGPSEAVRQTLARCIDRGEGIGILVGPAGTGKTLVCQVLAEQFRSRMAVAILSSGRLRTARNLFQAILFELGLPYRGMEEGELRLALVDHLSNKDTHPGGLLLLADEAHLLPLRMLDELRLLTNLQRGGQPRVRVVLSGNTSLEERLASPKLESFNQRIAARCYLHSFSHDETLAYVRAQIAAVDGQAELVFCDDALTAIHRSTDGIPRLVNQVCDHALILALAGGVRQIGAAGIEEAWADLQQLPTQWNPATATTDQQPDVIEFGALDDDVLPMKSSAEKPAREIVSGPRLHAIGDGSEAELFYGEPGERIEKIEARLNAIDADYDPPPMKMPEVELVFGEPDDPFEEEFAVEEVVVDRFADLASNAFDDRPLVTSAEGRELGAMLNEFRDRPDPSLRGDKAATSRNPPIVSLDRSDEAPLAAWNVPQEPVEENPNMNDRLDRTIAADFKRTGFRPAEDPVLPEESSTITIGIDASEVRFDKTAEIGEVEHEVEATEDDDLIVVDDDPPEPPPKTPSPPKAHRQEYRQLFARLRRG